ncbi:MAG: Clp protease N-terminal domain-containing protein [Acidimicrobiaceae bacterium]
MLSRQLQTDQVETVHLLLAMAKHD